MTRSQQEQKKGLLADLLEDILEPLAGWGLMLVTGGVAAGFLFLMLAVDTRRDMAVSPDIAARWTVPLAYVGDGFDDLRECPGEMTAAATQEGLIALGPAESEAAALGPATVDGPASLSYEVADVRVLPYWSLEPPQMTVRLKVRLAEGRAEMASPVDLALRGCLRISDTYWEDEEAEAAKTVRRAREEDDPAILARAEAYVEELAARKALLREAHEVTGTAQFEVRPASTFWASVLNGGFYVLLALTVVSGVIFGYCTLCLYIRLQAD